MSLDIGDALTDGLDRTTAPNGLLLIGVFVVFGLVNAIVQQSYALVQYERFEIAGAIIELLRGLGPLPVEEERIRQIVDQAMAQATPLAYLDGLSLEGLFALTIVLAFVAEAIRIVAVRTFVSEETETVPRDLARRKIGWATLNGVVGGVVVGALVILGLALFVLPGLFLFVVFFFVRQEIAIEDRNFVDAMAESWELTGGSRIEILGLALLLLVVTIAGSFVSDLFLGLGPAVASVANVVVTAVVLAYSVATVAQAYRQLAAGEETSDEDDDLAEYMDEELDPI